MNEEKQTYKEILAKYQKSYIKYFDRPWMVFTLFVDFVISQILFYWFLSPDWFGSPYWLNQREFWVSGWYINILTLAIPLIAFINIIDLLDDSFPDLFKPIVGPLGLLSIYLYRLEERQLARKEFNELKSNTPKFMIVKSEMGSKLVQARFNSLKKSIDDQYRKVEDQIVKMIAIRKRLKESTAPDSFKPRRQHILEHVNKQIDDLSSVKSDLLNQRNKIDMVLSQFNLQVTEYQDALQVEADLFAISDSMIIVNQSKELIKYTNADFEALKSTFLDSLDGIKENFEEAKARIPARAEILSLN